MAEESDRSSKSDGNDTNGSSNKEALSGSKTRRRENAAKRDSTGRTVEKGGSKKPPSEGAPTADGESIPSSVDPDAPSTTDSGSGSSSDDGGDE